MSKKMTPDQMRRKQIKELRGQVANLRKEQKQRHKIAEEKAELKQLMRQVHPSRIHKLTEVVAKRPHFTPERKKKVVSALKALKKAGQEFNKLRADIRKHGEATARRRER